MRTLLAHVFHKQHCHRMTEMCSYLRMVVLLDAWWAQGVGTACVSSEAAKQRQAGAWSGEEDRGGTACERS